MGKAGKTLHNHNHDCQLTINGMVGEKSKTLHSPPLPDCATDSGACIGADEMKEINAEIDRWYELLDVEYMRTHETSAD